MAWLSAGQTGAAGEHRPAISAQVLDQLGAVDRRLAEMARSAS